MVENILKHLKDRKKSHHIEVSQKTLEKYLISPISNDEENRILDEFEKNLKKKYKKALFIARMQPLHFGHLLAMKMALRAAESLVIGIGTSNITNEDNPWTLEEREDMLKNALQRNIDIKTGLSNVVHLPDFFDNNGKYDDPKWVEETIQRVGDVDVVISNNEWVCDLLSKKYYIISPPLFDREYFQGKKIRQTLRSKK